VTLVQARVLQAHALPSLTVQGAPAALAQE